MPFLPPASGFQNELNIRIIREVSERITCPEPSPDFLNLNFLVWSPKFGGFFFFFKSQVIVRCGSEAHAIGKRSQ